MFNVLHVCAACGAIVTFLHLGAAASELDAKQPSTEQQASDEPARGCNRQVHARISVTRSKIGVALQREQHLDIRSRF